MGYEVLLVSQFTLFGSIKRIHSFDSSLQKKHVLIIIDQVKMYCIYNIVSAENARIFYQGFVDRVKSMYKSDKVFDGEFQAYMNVELQNDGPTTLILDTDEYEGAVDFIRKRIEKEEKSKMSLIKTINNR